MTQDDMLELRGFLAHQTSNQYIHFGTIEAYVRKGYHVVEGKGVKTFDLANFENHAKRKGAGQFRALLPRLRKELVTNRDAGDMEYIYVESVLNERLAASLPSMGFKPVDKSFPPCFYMPLRRES